MTETDVAPTPDDLPQPEFEGTVPTDSLHVDGDNPNEQDEETFGLLCDRMRENGWLGGPIVTDTDGLIADGEHRWRAAQELGLDEVPVKQYDIDDATRRLWRQELNKIAGEHDPKRDALEYDQLLSAGKTEEVEALTDAAGEDLDDLLDHITADDGVPATYEYDVDHEVFFQDCVDGMADRVADDSVDCVITDPPYGVDVEENPSPTRERDAKHGGKIEGDASVDDATALFESTLREIERVTKHDAHLYVFTAFPVFSDFERVIEASEFEVRNVIVWSKSDTSPWRGNGTLYHFGHEWIIYATREGCDRELRNHDSDVMEHTDARFADATGGRQVHPTQKPVALVGDLLDNSTAPGDRVLDPFMGSGTTAVAAIQNDREYVGFEIDEENYRDVIERRIGDAKRQRDASVNADADADGAAAGDDD